MNDELTRQTYDADALVGQIVTLTKANTLTDAVQRVQELVDVRPLVWLGADNSMHVAPLSVRQIMQIITALEGLTVK